MNKKQIRDPKHLLVLHIGVIAIISVIGLIWVLYKGPIRVVKITTPIELITPWWYMFSAFPILGILIGDVLIYYIKERINIRLILLIIQIIIIIALSQLRLTLHLPISGHALLFSFTLLYRIVFPCSHKILKFIEIIVLILLVVLIFIMKILIWDDPVTFWFGILSGIILCGIFVFLHKIVLKIKII